MKEFKSLGSFSQFNYRKAALANQIIATGIHTMANHSHKVAISIFGSREKLTPELAEATQARREQLGFSPNDPLLRSGSLRDSVQVHSEGMTAGYGTNDDRMVYLENGTAKIPPRPLLAISVQDSYKTNEAIIITAAKMALGINVTLLTP